MKTYHLKYRLTLTSGKVLKVGGLIQGMCREHALEQGQETIEKIARSVGTTDAPSFVRIKKLNCGFHIRPKDEDIKSKDMSASLGFLDFLRDMAETIDRKKKAQAAKDYEDGCAKAREANEANTTSAPKSQEQSVNN